MRRHEQPRQARDPARARRAGARTSARRIASNSGSSRRQRLENSPDLPERAFPSFPRRSSGAPFAAGSDPDMSSARGPPPMIDACSEPGPAAVCGGRDCRSRSSASSRCSTRPMRMIASRPSARPAAVRGTAARLDVDPRETLVRDGDLQVGRLGDDGAVGRPLADERVGAEAGVLFVDDRRHDQPVPSRARAPPPDARGIDHGGHAALHVLRAAAVEPADRISGANGAAIPSTPTVSMCPQNISERPGARPSSTPITLGRPGATSCIVHVEPDAAHVRGDRRRDLPLRPPRRARATD